MVESIQLLSSPRRCEINIVANELHAHIAGAQRFRAGVRLRRTSDIHHCQGVVLAEWTATRGDGQALGTRTNVFMLGSDAKIRTVVGLSN